MKSIALIAGFCSLTLFASERPLKITNNCPKMPFTTYYKNELGFKDHAKIPERSTFFHRTLSQSIVLSWDKAQFQQRVTIDDNTTITIDPAIAIRLGAQQPIYRILYPEQNEQNIRHFYRALKKSSSSSSSSESSSSESSYED